MKATAKNTNKAKKAKPSLTAANDLSKFSLFFLHKYHHLTSRIADICMFAGLSDIGKMIDMFENGREKELLKLPGCGNDDINSLRKLCKEFNNARPAGLDL